MVNVLRLRLEPLGEDRCRIQVQGWPIGQFAIEANLAPALFELASPVNRQGALEQGKLLALSLLGNSRQRFLAILDELCKGSEQPSLSVESSETKLLGLPWEFLECSPGVMLLSDRRVPVYRSLGDSSTARIFERPRLLLASANPANLRYPKLVEADAEISEVATRMRNHTDIRTVRGATRDQLIASISEFRPHLFHFAGHGSRNGLVLESQERGRCTHLELNELGDLLQSTRTLFANFSCCSVGANAEVLLGHGVHACVASSGEVQDSAHRALVCRFYEALGAGERIDRALAHAQWQTHDFSSMWRSRLYLRGEPFSLRSRQEGAPEIFVGRRQELAELKRLLLDEVAPLVPIVGLGGAGKTTLIREFMSMASSAYDRVVFLDCGAYVSFDQVLGALAKELEIASTSDLPDALSDRRMLLCLDSFEGVLAGESATLDTLSSANAQILVSSRIWKQIGDESVLTLGGLDDEIAAIELLHRWCSRFGLERPDDQIARAMVQSVQGYPLALVVAAGRLKDLSPSDVLKLLDGGRSSLLQDVEAILNQALSLIDEGERRLLQRLSLFNGWFSLSDASEALDMDLADIADKAAELKHRGLLTDRDRHALFKVLDPVQDWLVGVVRSESESKASIEDQARFCSIFLSRADEIGALLDVSRWSEARESLWNHLPNFRRAIAISYERGDWRTVLGLTKGLIRLLFELGVWPEFELLLQAGHRAAEELGDAETTARLLGLQGAWEARTGHYRQCYKTWERRAAFSRDHGLIRHEVDALLDLGAQYEQDSNFTSAAVALREAHDLSSTLEDPTTRSNVQVILARHYQRNGNVEEAHRLVASASQLAGSSKEDIAIRVFLNISRYHRDQGDLPEAEAFLHKALTRAIESEHPYILSTLLLDALKLKSLASDFQLIGPICAALSLIESKVKSRLHTEALNLIRTITSSEARVKSIVEELGQQPLHVSLNIILERLGRRL